MTVAVRYFNFPTILYRVGHAAGSDGRRHTCRRASSSAHLPSPNGLETIAAERCRPARKPSSWPSANT